MLTNQKIMNDKVSDESGIFHSSKCIETPENLDKTLLQTQCILSLKAEFLSPKMFVMGEINTITEKLKTSTHSKNKHTHCREKIKYLREKNSSNILIIIKIVTS